MLLKGSSQRAHRREALLRRLVVSSTTTCRGLCEKRRGKIGVGTTQAQEMGATDGIATASLPAGEELIVTVPE